MLYSVVSLSYIYLLLQNPHDCKEARMLVVHLATACGFGCIVHKLAYNFILAIGLNRTLVLVKSDMPYHKKGWDAAFLPISRHCPYNSSRESKCSQHHIWSLRQQIYKIFMTEICIFLRDLCKIPVNSHSATGCHCLSWWS